MVVDQINMKMSVKAALRNNPSSLCATIPAVSAQQSQQSLCNNPSSLCATILTVLLFTETSSRKQARRRASFSKKSQAGPQTQTFLSLNF